MSEQEGTPPIDLNAEEQSDSSETSAVEVEVRVVKFPTCMTCGQRHDPKEGHTYLYTQEVEDVLLCPLCRKALLDPQISHDCGHIYCKSCVDAVKESDCKVVCGVDECPVVVSETKTAAAPIVIRQMVGKLLVMCPNCEKTMIRSKLASHIAHDCTEITDLMCEHAEKGCEFSGDRNAYNDHASSCAFTATKKYWMGLQAQIKTLEANNTTENHDLTSQGALLGMLVVRGPDWSWDDQDGGRDASGNLRAGTVRGPTAGRPGWIGVTWDDSDNINRYRFGADGCWDVIPARKAFSGRYLLGRPVVRYANWRWGCQDLGNVGWVRSYALEDNVVYVLWPAASRTANYRWAGKYNDIRLAILCEEEKTMLRCPLTSMVGYRVKRGVDWKWEDQDGGEGGLGRITGISGSGWVSVVWDHTPDSSNSYRYGMANSFDVEVVEGDVFLPWKKAPASWVVGRQVVRGPDWRWGDQDKGVRAEFPEDKDVGLVIDCTGVPMQLVVVMWASGKTNTYRWGWEGAYDLQLAPPNELDEYLPDMTMEEHPFFGEVQGPREEEM